MRARDLPRQAFEPGESVAEHGATFTLVTDLDSDGRSERAVVGVFETDAGERGRFLLILGRAGEAGWVKRALFSSPGAAGFSVLFWSHEQLVWAECMECDTACKLVTTDGKFDLKCESCCEV